MAFVDTFRRNSIRNLVVPAAAVMALALGAPPASAEQPPLGLALAVQPWTPITDDDSVHFILNSDVGISAPYNLIWEQQVDNLTKEIVDKLQEADLVMKGITFYDVKVGLTQPILRFQEVKGTFGAGRLHVRASLELNDEFVQLTSTTPEFIKDDPDADTLGDLFKLGKLGGVGGDFFNHTWLGSLISNIPNPHWTGVGSYGDPSCHVTFSITGQVSFDIQSVPGELLVSDQLTPDSLPVVDITNINFGADNAICAIPMGLIDALDLKPLIVEAITRPPEKGGVVEGPVNEAIRKAIPGLLKKLNATIELAIAPYRQGIDLLALGAWLVPTNGGQKLVLNLSPAWYIPDPTAGKGKLTGTITALPPKSIVPKDDKSIVPVGATVYCNDLPVTAARKTGPRAMDGPNGTLKPTQYEPLTVRTNCTGGQVEPGQSATYTFTGLSGIFPQQLTFEKYGKGCTAYEANAHNGKEVDASGWNEQNVLLPQDMYLPNADLNSILAAAKAGQVPSLFRQHNINAFNWQTACGGNAKPFENLQDKIAKVVNPADPALNVGRDSLLDKVGNASNLAAIANSGANIKPGSLLSTANKLAILNATNAPGLANAGAAAAAGGTTIRSNNIQINSDGVDGPIGTKQEGITGVGPPMTEAEQKERGLVTVGGGCSGTLINQYWVLTAKHCISVDGRLYNSGIGGHCQTVDLPSHIVVTATWSHAQARGTKLVSFCDSNDLDIGLIFLGNGDFGPVATAPLFVGDMDDGTPVRKFGQGISQFAIADPLTASSSDGYHTADFKVASVTHFYYNTPSNPPTTDGGPVQSGNGGDSGSSDWVIAPNGTTLMGIAGVQSTCGGATYVDGQPKTWTWATSIKYCTSVSIASIRDVIITVSQEKPAPLPELAKAGTDRPGAAYFSKLLDLADPNLCAQACKSDSSCQAWTYVLPGLQGLQAKCYLRNPPNAEVADSCCVSGLKAPLVVTDTPANSSTSRIGAGTETSSIPTSPAPGAGVTFDGEWLTWEQNAHMYTVFLRQDAKGRVYGSYEAGKIIDGVVVGNQLFARWQQQSGSGTLMLVQAPDGTTFGGIWANGDVEPTPKNAGGTWDGYRTNVYAGVLAPDFGGEWAVTQSDGKTYPMKLTQTPAGVGGSFDLGNRQGSIRGHVGIETFILNHLAFTWQQQGNNLSGEGRFYMTPDGNRFSGVWHMAGNLTGAWSAVRTAAAVAENVPSPGNGAGTTKVPKGPSKPLPTPQNLPTQATETIPPCVVPAPQAMDAANPWNGPWNSITGGGSKYSVVLRQSGGAVTGCFTPGNGVIANGTADGSTLTFHWMQDASAGGRYGGTAVFRLSIRNKNIFNGNWTADLAANGSGEWNGTRMGGGQVPDVNAGNTGNAGTGNAGGLGKIPIGKLGKVLTGSFAGDWDAVSGRSNHYAWHLDQSGTHVTGSYQPLNATISGNVSGQTLTFHWIEHQGGGAVSGEGDGKVTLSGNSFSGHWWTAADPDQNSSVNTWKATRTGGATIDVGGGGEAAGPVVR